MYYEAAEKERINEMYAEISKEAEDVPYAIEKRGVKVFTKRFTQIWPIVSFVSGNILVFFFARDASNIEKFSEAEAKSLLSFGVLMIVSGLVFGFIEYMKSRLNYSYWMNLYVRKRNAAKSQLASFVLASFLSATISALGFYMASLEGTGWKMEAKRKHELNEAQSRFDKISAQSDRAVGTAEAVAGNIGKHIESLQKDKIKDKGKMVTRWESGQQAAKLAPTLSIAEGEKTRATGERLQIEKDYHTEVKNINKRYGELKPNPWGLNFGESGKMLAMWAFIICLIAESIFIYCASYQAKYIQLSMREIGAINSNKFGNNKNISNIKDNDQIINNNADEHENINLTPYQIRQTEILIDAIEKLKEEYGQNPKMTELASELGWSYNKVREYVGYANDIGYTKQNS